MNEYCLDTLPNGLRIVTVEMPHLHSAEMICYLGVGGRDETAELAGISHFLEHILFRGTEEYPNSSLLERAFEDLGGAVNASTDSEMTCFHSRLHPDHIEEGAGLFASMLLRPLLTDVDMERRIILEEALEDLNEEGEDINPDNLTSRLLWPGHPLSLPTLGTSETIGAIDLSALRRHLETYFTPANAVVTVAGAVRRQEVVGAVAKAFGEWRGAPSPEPIPAAALTGDGIPEAAWVEDSDSQVSIQLCFATAGRGSESTVALRVLRWILSWGGSSRLMLRLRESLGLTYSVEANLSLFADTGCLSIDLAVAPENLVPAVAEALSVVDELCTEEVGEAEFSAVVKAYLFDLDFSRDHTEVMATRYGWGELVGQVRTIEQDRREISAVTSEALLKTAKETFRPERLKAAMVGPFRDEDREAVEKLMREFRKD